jgi:hypothetical protein
MRPSTRNTVIYVLVAACALVLASRAVTVGLMVVHAPEDAEPYFYLRQFVISALSIGAMIWLWTRRVTNQEGSDAE